MGAPHGVHVRERDHDLDAEALGGEAAHELEEVKGRRREEVEVWEEIEMCPLGRPAAMSKLTPRSPPRKEDMSRVMKAMMSAQERTPNASSDRKPASRTWCTLAARRRPGPCAGQPQAPLLAGVQGLVHASRVLRQSRASVQGPHARHRGLAGVRAR